MSDALALLWLPCVVSVVLVAIHTFLGLQVLARNVVFVDLALAQIAALGATVAFMLGHPVNSSGSYAYSLAFTLAAAVVLASTRSWSQRVPQEALVGVIYVVAAAAAFLVVEKAPQGTEHIKQLLTGNILTTGARDLVFAAPLYALVGFGLWAARARLARSAEGSSRWLWDFFFYACFGVVVTSSVALAGVLLVFSFLIIPAAIGMLYADGVRQLFIGWAVGVLASCAGLTASYVWDLPTGSAMVCAFGATLAIAGIVRPLRSSHTTVIAVRGARVGIALGLAASAAWIAIAPREDQPLLDAIELVSPPVREIYLSRNELQVYTDADEHAQRYSREADRLNDKEAQSRWQGEPLSDSEVRRISSFLQSYNEMRKGEEFVKREVRARARTRVRWMLAAVLLVAAGALFPWRLLTKPDAARRSLGSEPQAVQSNL